MPTYEYRCKECGNELEVVQTFAEDALTTCAVCGGPLRKLFGNVGIAFKGSGFYKNDSRGKPASTSSGNGSDGGSSSGDSGTPSSTPSEPSKKAETTSTPAPKTDSGAAKKADSSSKSSTSKSA